MAQILLEDKLFHVSKDDFPILIHGKEHSGSSFFSVALIADTIHQGQPVIFFTKYPKAKEMLYSLIPHEKDILQLFHERDFGRVTDQKVIIVDSGNEELFLKTLRQVEKDRIIFVKNAEMYSESLILNVLAYPYLIMCGDIDVSAYKEQIVSHHFPTKILFSSSSAAFFELPELEKYDGLLLSKSTAGIVRVI